MIAFQLDTSGEVTPSPDTARGFTHGLATQWGDLTPFAQGYVEALLWNVRDLWRLTELEPDGTPPREGPYWIAFRDLAPETLARIIADCADAASILGRNGRHDDGEWFWNGGERQPGFSPLTVHLCDDGKVRFA